MIFRFALRILAGLILVPTTFAQVPTKPRTDSLGDPLPIGAIARLGTLRLKHEPAKGWWIGRAIFSPNGKLIASVASLEGMGICIWDARTGKEIAGPWNARPAQCRYTAIAFSPKGAILAAVKWLAPNDNGLKPSSQLVLWDCAGSTTLHTHAIPEESPETLAFADDGKTLVCASRGAVSWWDVATGKAKRAPMVLSDPQSPWAVNDKNKKLRHEDIYHCVLSPDGKSLAVQVIGHTVQAIRPEQFTPKREPAGKAMEDIPQGPKLPWGQTVIFDLASGKVRWRVDLTKALFIFPDHRQVVFSADGNRIAVVAGINTVELHDTLTSKLIGTVPLNTEEANKAWIGPLALSSDGETMAISRLIYPSAFRAYAQQSTESWDTTKERFFYKSLPVAIWSVRNPTSLRTLEFEAARSGRSEMISCWGFSADNKNLLVGAGISLRLFEVATLREVLVQEGHQGRIDALGFSTDAKRLHTISGLFDHREWEAITWDTATWKKADRIANRTPKWPHVGLMSPDGSYFVGKDGEDRFKLYSMANGTQVGRFVVPRNQSTDSRSFFSPTSKLFVLAGVDAEGQAIDRVYRVPSCKLICELPRIVESFDCRSMAISADDRLVALLDEEFGQIRVLEAASGRTIYRLCRKLEPGLGIVLCYLPYPCSLAFSPDGKLLASWILSEDGVQVWDLTTGRELMRLMPRAPAGFLGQRKDFENKSVQLAWSPESRMLAVAGFGEKPKIQLWEMATRKLRREFTGHDGHIRALAFSPDGQLLASGSEDTTVLIWDMWGR